MTPRLMFLLLTICITSYGQGYRVFIGTYTQGEGKGIYSFRFDTSNGQCSAPELAAATVNPSFLAIEQKGKYLYAVNETDDFQGKKEGAVSAYSIESSTGSLTLLQQVTSMGGAPAHISIDRSARNVMVANYTGGSVAVFPIGSDGKLKHFSAFVQHRGSGADRDRQAGPHAHFIHTTTDNATALAADLGADQVFVYSFDPSKGHLRPATPPSLRMLPGSGPRHIAFAPDGKSAYVLNELTSTVTLLRLVADSRKFEKDRSVSTLPQNFSGKNMTAEIAIDAKGMYLYASNRGDNSIVRFVIGAKDGMLSDPDWTPSGGSTPRYFCLDPTGNWLLAANQNSDNIMVFRIDRSTGRLRATSNVLRVPSPVCIVFAG